jgi:alpha-tubulin suppressor-like RCC1 family protein
MKPLRPWSTASLLVLILVGRTQAEDVTWLNPVGVSVAGNGLTKTGGSSAWNAGAASNQVIRDGYGYVDFAATETTTQRACGLSVGDPGQTLAEIDYAVELRAAGVARFYQSGAWFGSQQTYVTGDRFRVEAAHGVVRFLKNGTVLATASALPAYPLRVDAALYTPGSTLSDVKVGNAVWTMSSGMSVANGTLTKTGAAGWNAGAFSANLIARGDGFVEFTAGQATTSRAAGLGAHNPSQVPLALADIEYAIHLRADGIITVTQSGAPEGDFGGYIGSDRFRVEIRGATVRYLKNGAEFHSHGVTPTYPLRLEAAFESAGASLQDLLLEEFVWTDDVGVTVAGATLVKTGAGGWNASAASTASIASGDGWMEFTAIETDTRRAAGLNSGSAALTWSDIDFAIELTETGTVRVLESGTLRWDLGTYAHGDRLRVEVQEGIVRYLQNGTLLYTSAVTPTYPLRPEAALDTSGATVVDASQGDVVWTGVLGLQQRGAVLRRTTSGATPAGGVSTRAFNTGSVEATASETTTTRSFGLSHGDVNTTYQDIDYAIRLTGTSARAYEKGVAKGSAVTFAAGDRFRVEVAASQVKYYRNGGLFYTSLTAPVLALRADTSYETVGASVLGITVSGTAVSDTLEPPILAPGTGNYSSEQNVAITAYPGATVRYTTDGSTPTTASEVYAGPVLIDATLTLKAKAWKEGFTESAVASAVYTLKVATPAIAPGTGTYTTSQLPTVTCTSPGVTIHYTTTGVEPTEADQVVPSGGSVPVDVSLTLKVKAWRTGWTPSNTTTAIYTLKVATPTLAPGGGSYSSPTNVVVATVTPGATLHYTTTGTEPTTSDLTVTSGGTVPVASTTMLRVKGVRAGWTNSDTGAGAYFMTMGTVAAPTMDPPAGTYTQAQLVALSTVTAGAVIRYTTDGTEPGLQSPLYGFPITVDKTGTVKAKAFRADWAPSAIATAAYTVNTGDVDTPTLSPGPGTYVTHQLVKVECSTPGATIHYTTDGRVPTEADDEIGSGDEIDVAKSLQLRARAFKSGLNPSAVRTADYRLQGAVVAGSDHSLALKADGSIWAWGIGSFGRLGNGGTTDQWTPVQVSQATGLTDAVAIAGGGSHSLAIDRDGRVWGWGKATSNGWTADRSVPGLVAGAANSEFVAVAAGHSYGLGLKKDGTVWAWGGMFSISYGHQMVQIAGLTGVSSISRGYDYAIALKTDGMNAGSLWGWGNNAAGQLGDGTTLARTSPVLVANISDAVAVAAAYRHTVAVNASGSVLSWGTNLSGQLGDGTAGGQPRLYPGLINGLSATSVSGFSHSVAVSSEGRAYGWGLNNGGQVGNGMVDSTGAQARTPPDLVATANLLYASVGNAFTLALREDSTVWAWGTNANGRMGVGAGIGGAIIPIPLNLQLVDNTWPSGDLDGDGLSNDAEAAHGTDPLNPDTNGDGVLDGAAVSSGLSATDLDMDDDGVVNQVERTNGTDPFLADTDGDGVADATDAFPLDPTRWQAPTGTPGDTTPPIITLLEPNNAVPVP